MSGVAPQSADRPAAPAVAAPDPPGPPAPATDPAARLLVRLEPGTALPRRAHLDDAGLDLTAAAATTIPAGGRALVDTGLSVALPAGTVGLVCPRSGLAARHGITVLNGPGVVDAGYRGPVKVALHNTDPAEDFAVEPGDRIAQLVVVPVLPLTPVAVEDLDATGRAAAGFGSSGGFGSGGGSGPGGGSGSGEDPAGADPPRAIGTDADQEA